MGIYSQVKWFCSSHRFLSAPVMETLHLATPFLDLINVQTLVPNIILTVSYFDHQLWKEQFFLNKFNIFCMQSDDVYVLLFSTVPCFMAHLWLEWRKTKQKGKTITWQKNSCLFYWVNPHLINLQMSTNLMQKRYESEKESHTELIP